MKNAEIGAKPETMSRTQMQAVDAMYLLLDTLEDESSKATDGALQSYLLTRRLGQFMGAFCFIADTFETAADALEGISRQIEAEGVQADG